MKKFNRIISIMMIFIVLLSTVMQNSVIASGEEAVEEVLYIPGGTGTSEDDPYIIDVSGYSSSNYSVKFEPSAVPFYFTVAIPGVYIVEYNSLDGKCVTFTLISSGNDGAKVEINNSKYKFVKDNWQLGIKTSKRSRLSAMGPAYVINEHSSYIPAVYDTNSYYLKPNGEITSEPNNANDILYGDGSVTEVIAYPEIKLGFLGDDYGDHVERTITLSSVTYQNFSSSELNENNLFYFTNISERKRAIYFIRV